MRLIVVGCEYTGVTTLIEGLMAWGDQHGIHHHLDDHFAIPDSQHLTLEESQAMLALPPVLKERFQRFQLVYHVRLLHRYQHILLGGFHIEEAVYGPLYYYPGVSTAGIREYEPDMPEDTILVHLKARPDVIASRLSAHPHEHTVIAEADIPMLLERFEEEYRASWLHHKFQIDTSDLSPEDLLQTFLDRSVPYLNSRDALTRMMGSATISQR
jgi:hypothetical protein